MNKVLLFPLVTFAAAQEFDIAEAFQIAFNEVKLNVLLPPTYDSQMFPAVNGTYSDIDKYKIVKGDTTWSLVYTGEASVCTLGSMGYTIVNTDHTVLTALLGEKANYADTVHDGYMDVGCATEILPETPPPADLSQSAVPIDPISMCDLLSESDYVEAQCCDELREKPDRVSYINADCCSC